MCRHSGFIPLSTLDGRNFFQGVAATSEDDEEQTRLDFITTHTLSIGIERNPFLSEVGYSVKRNKKRFLVLALAPGGIPSKPPF